MLPIKNTRSILLAIVFATILIMFSGQLAHAAHVILQWDANTESDLAGYKVYYGTVSHNYSDSVDVGNVTSYTIAGLVESQTYYFAVTAYDTQKLKTMAQVQPAGFEAGVVRKGAILGALSLYLDFINLFLMMLMIFGSGRE